MIRRRRHNGLSHHRLFRDLLGGAVGDLAAALEGMGHRKSQLDDLLAAVFRSLLSVHVLGEPIECERMDRGVCRVFYFRALTAKFDQQGGRKDPAIIFSDRRAVERRFRAFLDFF